MIVIEKYEDFHKLGRFNNLIRQAVIDPCLNCDMTLEEIEEFFNGGCCIVIAEEGDKIADYAKHIDLNSLEYVNHDLVSDAYFGCEVVGNGGEGRFLIIPAELLNVLCQTKWLYEEVETWEAGIEEIADMLESGVSSDIWYDAHEYGDDSASNTIEATQDAMLVAAKLLRKL